MQTSTKFYATNRNSIQFFSIARQLASAIGVIFAISGEGFAADSITTYVATGPRQGEVTAVDIAQPCGTQGRGYLAAAGRDTGIPRFGCASLKGERVSIKWDDGSKSEHKRSAFKLVPETTPVVSNASDVALVAELGDNETVAIGVQPCDDGIRQRAILISRENVLKGCASVAPDDFVDITWFDGTFSELPIKAFKPMATNGARLDVSTR